MKQPEATALVQLFEDLIEAKIRQHFAPNRTAQVARDNAVAELTGQLIIALVATVKARIE